MSIEAMKQVIELYDKHCYNNDYGGIEFNKKHGYKFIEAIEALRTAIQQAEAKTGEPVVSRNPFASRCYTLNESHLSGHRLIVGFEKMEDAQDAHEWVARQGRGDFTHPAPGVPDGWSDRHKRVAAFALRRFADAAWERADEAAQKSYMGNPGDYKAFQGDAKDAEEARSILLTAAQAQKGGE